MSLNRYALLKNKKFKYLPVQYLYPSIITGFTIIVLPLYFTFEIVPMNKNSTDKYMMETTKFGKTTIMAFYSIVLLILESVVPIILNAVLAILIILKFKDVISKKIALNSRNRLKLSEREMNFTKITTLITIIFTILKIFDFMSSTPMRFLTFFSTSLSDRLISVFNFIKVFVFLLTYLQYTFNIFIYLLIDKNFFKVFKSYFSRHL